MTIKIIYAHTSFIFFTYRLRNFFSNFCYFFPYQPAAYHTYRHHHIPKSNRNILGSGASNNNYLWHLVLFAKYRLDPDNNFI